METNSLGKTSKDRRQSTRVGPWVIQKLLDKHTQQSHRVNKLEQTSKRRWPNDDGKILREKPRFVVRAGRIYGRRADKGERILAAGGKGKAIINTWACQTPR